MDNLKYNATTVKLLLDTAKSEYNNEHNRTTVIDSKTSIALPIVSAYFLALAQMNDYKTIFTFQVSSFKDSIIPTIMLITYTCSLISALVAVTMFAKVIAMKDYNVIKVEDLYDDDYLIEEPIYITIKLTKLYIDATSFNKRSNNLRIPIFKKGWQLTVVSVALFVIYILIKNII